jgi:curved DNA-binding protein CbpA
MDYRYRKDYYEILQVQRDASRDEIRKAYRALVKANHPDLAKDPSIRKQREEFLKVLNEAYEILWDDIKRNEYDAKTATVFTNPYQRATRQPESGTFWDDREPPDVLIRGNEQLLRIEYVKRRFPLKHDLGYYIRNNIIRLYTTPEGYIYISLSDLGRARQADIDPEAAKAGMIPTCAACGRTDASLRERYFVRNSGFFSRIKMRIRGGVLCSKCRQREKWAAVLHNVFYGWWGFEAAAYNPGFITINLMGGFRGRHSTRDIQGRLRTFSLKHKRYDVFQDLQKWNAKLATSLPNFLVDQLLYNHHHTFKAALFTVLTVIVIVKIMLMLS